MDDSVTLGRARQWLRERASEGDFCPCCRQKVKIYRRSLNASMCRRLIEFYKWNLRDGSFHHFAAVLNPLGYYGADYSKLAYWGLLDHDPEKVGFWRISTLGIRFVQQQSTVPSHAVVYDGKVLRLDGTNIFIQDALKKKFDYAELMADCPPW